MVFVNGLVELEHELMRGQQQSLVTRTSPLRIRYASRQGNTRDRSHPIHHSVPYYATTTLLQSTSADVLENTAGDTDDFASQIF